jgi:hypothetical protein
MYGAGGGGGGDLVTKTGGNGFAGLVIIRYLISANITATGGQEVVTP